MMCALPAILILSTVLRSGLGQTSEPFVAPVNIPGTTAKLPGVKGVAVDAAGNVFFVSGQYSVLRWDAATGVLTSVAGNGTPGYSGDNGPATSAQLNGAVGVAVDVAGNLYIADSNNYVVRKVSHGVITTVAGNGTPGFSGDNGPATSAYLSDLIGLAADSAGNLYLFTSQQVRKVSNGVITKFLGAQDGLYAIQVNTPSTAPAVDSAGNLYVADTTGQRVRKVSNGAITTVAGDGVLGFSGDNGPATSAHLGVPKGVAVDAAGNIYIADTGNQRIRKVSNGVITTVVGGGPPSGGLGDNGPATSALLNYPFGVGVDSAGNLYVEDTLDQRIRKVSNGVITTVAGGGSYPVLLARSAGKFAATSSMSTARGGHTATLLDTSRVLIAGGDAGGTADLYDSATRTFTPTGNMTEALAQTIATLLGDGRVLIVGTTRPNDFDVLASAELYDPSAGTFTSAGNLLNIVRPVTATLLINGKVLITGDTDPDITAFAAELYDPSTGKFTTAGSMIWPHFSPTATSLRSGKVLLAERRCDAASSGGYELYDPATGTFSAAVGAMSCISVGPTATLLSDGQVLIGGDLYDPSTETFTALAGVVQMGNTATLLPDETVLITGGEPCGATWESCNGVSVADAYLRDPSTGTFGSAGVMSTPRTGHQATLLPDGTVLISGGGTRTLPGLLASAEIYTPPGLVPAPALFSLSGDGQGQGAIWHAQTGQIASSQNPAVAGEILAMYTTSLVEGGVIPPQVAVGGRLAEVLFFGDAPGYPGYNQVNFRMPTGVAAGSAAAVRLTYLSRPSNPVTIGVH